MVSANEKQRGKRCADDFKYSEPIFMDFDAIVLQPGEKAQLAFTWSDT